MSILGFIIIIVGIALIIVGKNVASNVPPNYQDNDDGSFLQLLQSMGKLIGGAGMVFLVTGLVCMVIGVLGMH